MTWTTWSRQLAIHPACLPTTSRRHDTDDFAPPYSTLGRDDKRDDEGDDDMGRGRMMTMGQGGSKEARRENELMKTARDMRTTAIRGRMI